MSRIRSVHPGLWTDERFASLSPIARVLFIGIWNECDDQGSFEWSPLKLKMRLLPADSADVSLLLAEIDQAGCIMQYEAGGRKLGAVRNFCRFQRPKKPNSTYLQTGAVRTFVDAEARSTRDGSEPVGNQSRTGGENDRQRKEEGGKRKDADTEATASVRAAARGSRIPDDFVVPEEWRAWATAEEKLTREAVDTEAASFVDYWRGKGGRDGVKLDWQATWRNWARRSDRPRRNGKGGGGGSDGFQIGGVRMASPC